ISAQIDFCYCFGIHLRLFIVPRMSSIRSMFSTLPFAAAFALTVIPDSLIILITIVFPVRLDILLMVLPVFFAVLPVLLAILPILLAILPILFVILPILF